MKLVLASSNRGKLQELRELLDGHGIELLAQSDLGVEDAEETGTTFVENALLKARHASRRTSLPALADDSGICVDALHGAPGLYSARYAGEHGNASGNIDKLLQAMRDLPDARRSSVYGIAHATITPVASSANAQGGRSVTCCSSARGRKKR